MTVRSLFHDAVKIERRSRTATNARAAEQAFDEVAPSAPCRIVDQTTQASMDTPLGAAGTSSALIFFLPEQDVKLGDVLTSLAAPTLDRKWRVTALRQIDRHSLQCTCSEVQDQ